MDRLQCMQIFVRVVECQSFARAAAALGLSRARTSEAVANLERALDTRLVHRTTRRLRLSDEGRGYYERCVAILADVADAEAALSAPETAVRGRLRVHVPIGLARACVLPALPALLARHPELGVELRLDNRAADLFEEGLDCAIAYGVPRDPELVARKLAVTRLLTCAAPSYLRERPAPRAPADLAAHACIAFLSGGSAAQWVFAHDGQRVAWTPDGRLAFNSMEACVEAAMLGLGVTQVLSTFAQRAVRDGALVPLLLDCAVEGPALYLAHPPHRHVPARLAAFIELARSAFADVERPLDGVTAAPRGARRRAAPRRKR